MRNPFVAMALAATALAAQMRSVAIANFNAGANYGANYGTVRNTYRANTGLTTAAVKRAAIKAHESQVDNHFFLGLDDAQFASLLGTERYALGEV